MKLEFVVEWGYKHIYFREDYLPSMNFDGKICVQKGKLVDVKRMVFRKDRFGTHVQTPLFISYGKENWESEVCNNFDGFLFSVDGDEKTVVEIATNSANGKFTLGELLKKEHLVYDTENPFLFAVMHVYLKNHEWYVAKKKENELRINGNEFSGEQNSFFGVNGVVVPCQESVKTTFHFAGTESNSETIFRTTGLIRVIQSKSTETDECAEGVADYQVKINGTTVYENSKFHYTWDDHSVNLEENFFEFPYEVLRSGENTLEIVNQDSQLVILAQMVRLFTQPLRHLDVLRCPQWAVKGKPFSVKIYTIRHTILSIVSD